MAPAGPPVVLQLDGGAVGGAVHIHGDGVHLGYMVICRYDSVLMKGSTSSLVLLGRHAEPRLSRQRPKAEDISTTKLV